MGLAVTVTTAPDWVGDGVEAAGKRSKSSFSVFPGGSFWEQAAFSALTSAPYVSVGRVMIQLSLTRVDIQFTMIWEFGTFSKHFTQSSTTFENAPFSVSQYWYCIVALVCRSLSTNADLAVLFGP